MALPFNLLDGFAYSFSHAVITVEGKLYSAIKNVRLSQRLQESAVYGTARAPLGRSAGQLELGQGTLVFSDVSEAFDMFQQMSPDPLFRTWSLDYTLVNEKLEVRSIALRSCRLIGFDLDHEEGPDALSLEYPFSFLSMTVNGNQLALGVQAVAQGLARVISLF